MAAPINIDVIDTPDVEQTQFGADMKRWLANAVDVLNSNFTILRTALAITSADIGGSGAGPITVTVLGLNPTTGNVTVNLLSSSNPVSITDVSIGTNQFTVTFSGDPGASAIIQYSAYTVIPQ